MATSTPATQSADERKKRKRGAILKFSLAGGALLGIAAAATSAAWTDNAWFTATATGATFELQGLNFASTPSYEDADADGTTAAIVIPDEKLKNLVPGSTRTFTLNIKNAGTVDQTIAKNYEWRSASPANDFAAAPTVAITGTPNDLHAGTNADITVTVTTPSDWSSANQSKSESLAIVFTGTSVAN